MELNKRGVPTATGRGIWEQGRVGRVMERFKRNADLLKPHEAAFKSVRREVVGVALDDRKIDLDLVEPAGVKRV